MYQVHSQVMLIEVDQVGAVVPKHSSFSLVRNDIYLNLLMFADVSTEDNQEINVVMHVEMLTSYKAGDPFMRLHCVCVLNHYMYLLIGKLTQTQMGS